MSDARRAIRRSNLLVGLLLLASCPYGGEKVSKGPRCSDCSLLVDEVAECDHPASAKDGDPCDEQHCIHNSLQTGSCIVNPNGDEPSTCNAALGGDDAVFQQRRLSDFCGDPEAKVQFRPWHTVAGGCGDSPECTEVRLETACELLEATQCEGAAVGPGVSRGLRFDCGGCE